MSPQAPSPSPASPLRRAIVEPLQRFLHVEAASGVVLLLASVAALLWANSPWTETYVALWHEPLVFEVAGWIHRQPLHFWINDGLMTVFFLVVGLELRRELHDGTLSSLRLAMLPAIAALGGVVAPASIYLLFADTAEVQRGWAVPTATDIAFAVGVLALLGPRVSSSLRVLLLSVAVIDDLLAILIIALFYSHGVALGGLAIAVAGVALVMAFQRAGVRSAWAYLLPGLIVWTGMLASGVHPALAGVILGLLTPTSTPIGPSGGEAPLERVQRALHPWVAFGIMPLFALANAGVHIEGSALQDPRAVTLSLGVLLGLVLGKPIGIALATLLALRLKVGQLPVGVDGRGIVVIGCLAGIGFTMAIFIADLAFQGRELLASAKLAVLCASGLAAVIGLVLGRLLLRLPDPLLRPPIT